MKLDLTHLESLEAVVSCGSFARAAEQLNKARSAVSYDVRCLEARLGVPLLDRAGYRARLTDAGAMILREGASVLSQARALEQLAVRLQSKWEPVVTLVMEGALPMGPVLGAIRSFGSHDAPTLIELKTEFLDDVPARFEEDRADLMLAKHFEAPVDEYVVDLLPKVECVLVAAGTHPLNKGRGSVTRGMLRGHLELNIQPTRQGTAHMTDRRLGVPRTLNLSGFFAKKEALLMGLGFGWIPRALIEGELADGRLKRLAFEEGNAFEFTPCLMHRKDRPLGQAGRLFRSLLLEAFSA